jgi:uncharacterized protein YggE
MRLSPISSIALVCLGVGFPASAQPAPGPTAPVPTIVTQGSATVRVAPDRAFVTFATEATAPAPTTAQQRIAQAMTAVRSKLRSIRVPDDAIKTVAYSIHEDWAIENMKRVSKGYRAQNSIEVRLDELERVGEVIDAAVQAGATAVGEIRFDLKDRDGVERQALKQAVTDARARADAIAAAAGVTIASIVRIDEQGRVVPVPRPMPMVAMRAGAMEQAPETPVSPGEIDVHASVTLTVAIR